MPEIIVKKLSDTSVLVGKKVVYKDTENRWKSISELTQKEREAFEKYQVENM